MEYTPSVDETQEFIEIANDFSNPLDLIRECISNSFDAQATLISIVFDTRKILGRDTLRITMSDNGQGMNEDEMKSFFDLGNSFKKKHNSNNKDLIGEKGHGTKVF